MAKRRTSRACRWMRELEAHGASSPGHGDRGFVRSLSVQNVTTSLSAAVASAGRTLRATKSSQFLNFALARASTITFERAGPICGSLSSSATVAVFRLTLAATGAVAAPVVLGFAAGAGVVDGCIP